MARGLAIRVAMQPTHILPLPLPRPRGTMDRMGNRVAVAVLLLALLGVGACGDMDAAQSASEVVGVYRMEPLANAEVPAGVPEDLISTLSIILRNSELSLMEDRTFEWRSFFLSDQGGRWIRQGDTVTIQPAADSDGLPSSLTFHVGDGTLTLIPDGVQAADDKRIVLKRE